MSKTNRNKRQRDKPNSTKVDVMGKRVETGPSDLSGLTPKQREVLPRLVSVYNIEASCRDAGISKETYYKWLQEDAFRKAIEGLRTEMIELALLRLKQGLTKAVDRLLLLVDSDREYVALGASNSIVEHFIKMSEIRELQRRIETLERGVQDSERGDLKNVAKFNEAG